jgi:hypothetical protein
MQEADLGAIASSLSPAIGFFGDALDRMYESDSLKYSQLGRSSIQRVYVAFEANSDLCHSFLQHCANYGETVLTCLTSIASPTTSRLGASHDLREWALRNLRLQSEMTGISAGNAASAQLEGLSSYQWTPFDGNLDKRGQSRESSKLHTTRPCL